MKTRITLLLDYILQKAQSNISKIIIIFYVNKVGLIINDGKTEYMKLINRRDRANQHGESMNVD